MKYLNVRRPPRWLPGVRYVNLMDGEWDDLAPLLQWAPRLLGLSINTVVSDISAIPRFKNLKELAVGEYCSGGFALERLEDLEDFWLHVGGARPVKPNGGRSLVRLGLSHATQEWARWIETLSTLRELRLDSPRGLPSLLPGGLEVLDIADVKHWGKRVQNFEGATGLRELHLVGIRGMEDLRAFAFAQRLSVLYLEDCGELISLEGPGLAPDAKVLRIGLTPRG